MEIDPEPPMILNVDKAYDNFKTENDLLEMSKHFKEVLEDKSSSIKHLTKVICTVYGVISLSDFTNDHTQILFLSEYLDNEMHKLLGLED